MSEDRPNIRRDALVEAYRDYVHAVVGTLVKSMNLPLTHFDEFVSAGYLGLVEAATRFNPAPGREFKPFAFLRIRGAVIDSIRECADTTGKAYRFVKALQAAQELRKEDILPDDPTAGSKKQALADVLEYASKGVLAFRLSIDDVEEEMSDELGPPSTPEELFTRSSNREILLAAVATLPEKERLVIEGFYFKDLSFTEIAEASDGLSKSWVSRLHAKGIQRLKESLLALENPP